MRPCDTAPSEWLEVEACGARRLDAEVQQRRFKLGASELAAPSGVEVTEAADHGRVAAPRRDAWLCCGEWVAAVRMGMPLQQRREVVLHELGADPQHHVMRCDDDRLHSAPNH